jgi:hypothetical protein
MLSQEGTTTAEVIEIRIPILDRIAILRRDYSDLINPDLSPGMTEPEESRSPSA